MPVVKQLHTKGNIIINFCYCSENVNTRLLGFHNLICDPIAFPELFVLARHGCCMSMSYELICYALHAVC